MADPLFQLVVAAVLWVAALGKAGFYAEEEFSSNSLQYSSRHWRTASLLVFSRAFSGPSASTRRGFMRNDGVGRVIRYDIKGLPVEVATEVKGCHSEKHMEYGEVRRTDLYTQWTMAAASQAMEGSGILGEVPSERLGVFFGSCMKEDETGGELCIAVRYPDDGLQSGMAAERSLSRIGEWNVWALWINRALLFGGQGTQHPGGEIYNAHEEYPMRKRGLF